MYSCFCVCVCVFVYQYLIYRLVKFWSVVLSSFRFFSLFCRRNFHNFQFTNLPVELSFVQQVQDGVWFLLLFEMLLSKVNLPARFGISVCCPSTCVISLCFVLRSLEQTWQRNLFSLSGASIITL